MDRHVIDVGSSKQLFVDKMFIDSSTGVELVMNPPYQTREPVLVLDESWETQPEARLGRSGNSVVKEDDGSIRIWYSVDDPGNDERYVSYAESSDGIHFTKPVLDLIDVGGTTANNAVIPSQIGGSSVWIDPNAPPEERYKTQAKVYSPEVWGQFHMHTSPDGIRWKLFENIRIGRGGWDTQSIVSWDPRIGRYVLYTRYWVAKRHGTAEGNESYRTVRRLESDDLRRWDNQSIVMWPDEVDMATYETSVPLRPTGPDSPQGRVPMDYYGALVFKYPDAETGVYIMLAHANWCWYDSELVVTSVRDDLEVERQETRTLQLPSRFDTRLAVSRDGKSFQRCGGRKPFMRPGPEGSFSSRMTWEMPNPIRVGDELWIYYAGVNWDENRTVDPAAQSRLSGIDRAVMRLDGFVSADADYSGGELLTPSIRFSGSRLELNVDTGAGGSVLVELQHDNGQPVPGYTEQEATFICGNSVRMPVCWGERQDVSELAGKPIKIRFKMRDCKLYAFQFMSDRAPSP